MLPKALVDKRELFKRLEYEPHSEEQWEAHNSTARYRIPCCGRRWGKSQWAGHEMTYRMFMPDTRHWIVGPSYDLAEKEFRVVYMDFMKLGITEQLKTCVYNVKQGDMRITTPWNAILEVRSAHRPETLVGEGLHSVIMSEAAKHSRETWERFIRPALADYKGHADFPSTPEGFNWYKGLWDLARQDEFPDYEGWSLPSWTNPILYPGGYDDPEIQLIRSTVSEKWFRQEIGAEFTTFEGQIYEEFDENIHVTHIPYNPAWRNYWVFDFGFTDPFVCLDIMVDPDDNVYVWREYQVRGKPTYDHGIFLKEYRENPEGFHVDLLLADPRGADAIATLQLLLGGIRANPVPWEWGVEAVKRHLKLQPDGKPKLFIDFKCRELIRQMLSLRAKDAKEGHNAKEGQHDYDDHGPDALRYFFSEIFVLGAGASLSQLYDSPSRTEADSFFTLNSKIALDSTITRYG